MYSKYIKVVTFVYNLNSDEARMNTHHYLWIFWRAWFPWGLKYFGTESSIGGTRAIWGVVVLQGAYYSDLEFT